MNVDITSVIVAIMSAGGALAIRATFQGMSALRSGAQASTRDAIRDLGALRDDADARARMAERDVAYWQGVAGSYAYQLRRAGVVPNPENPVAPSQVPAG